MYCSAIKVYRRFLSVSELHEGFKINLIGQPGFMLYFKYGMNGNNTGGYFMKRFFVIILALIFALSLSACFGPRDDINDKTPSGATDNTQNDAGTGNDKNKTEEVTVEEQVIYEGNDIVVTVKGFNKNSLLGPEVKVLIENNFAKNITVQTRKSSVNGLMTETVFSADVAAGKKVNDAITFMSSKLKAAGITTIKDIEFSLHIFDTESMDTIVDTDLIKLKTSVDESFVQKFDDSGFTAYDADGIKVVVKEMNSSESFWGSDIYLYIENNTDKDITVQARDVSVDGFMIDPMFSSDVVAGKKAFDTMTFMESDLKENDIKEINSLEFKLHIFDMDTWETIKDTDIIKVSFE